MYNTISKALPKGFKQSIRSFMVARTMKLPPEPRAFIFLAADYGNIGDIAISAAQKLFIQRSLPRHQVKAIPISVTRESVEAIRRRVRGSDVITIVGGGNMGHMYSEIEEFRQLVIQAFPSNRIVSFPQSIDWDQTAESVKALDRIQKVYSLHPDLHLFARDSVSFLKLQQLFKREPSVKVKLAPDIVLSSRSHQLGSRQCVRQDRILVCLRQDRERTLTDGEQEVLFEAIRLLRLDFETTDTHAGGNRLTPKRCSELLGSKINQFSGARLVITDRLHGMILAVLAGTPCIVFPNSNHKIRQTYLDWLQSSPLVTFLEPNQLSRVPEVVRHMIQTHDSESLDGLGLDSAFSELNGSLAYYDQL